MNTPVTPTSLQPNTQYYNPSDGKQYLFKQLNPDGSAVMINPQTQEESVLPSTDVQEQQLNSGGQSTGLKPVMKTTTNRRNVMANDIDKIVNDDESHGNASAIVEKVQDHLLSDIEQEIQEMQRAEQGIEGDINEMVEDANLFNELAGEHHKPTDMITSVKVPDGVETKHVEHPENLMKPDDDDYAINYGGRPAEDVVKGAIPILASTKAPVQVVSKHIPWMEYRKKITTVGQVERLKKDAHHLKKVGLTPVTKDLTFHPDKRDVVDSGHSIVNNIPVSSPPKEKDMTIGMTEFPKDQKRDDSVGLDTGKGYNIPMKAMDENQVANREKFNNEQRQYMDRMTIRQYRELLGGTGNKEVKAIEKGKGIQPEREPVKPEANNQYSVEKTAIAQAVGLVSLAEIEFDYRKKKVDPTIPSDKPVEHKPTQKAPVLKEYVEPGIIQPASKEIQLFLDSFMQHYQRLQTLKDALATALAPHQKEMADISTQHMPAITEEEKLLKDALEMAYKAISVTEDSLVHYREELWAALSRTKTLQPAVTVAQVIAEAQLIDQHLAEEIDKLAKKVGEKGQSKVRERFLYEYPPSQSHEKRMKPQSSLLAIALNILLEDVIEIIHGFVSLNSEIKEALSILG